MSCSRSILETPQTRGALLESSALLALEQPAPMGAMARSWPLSGNRGTTGEEREFSTIGALAQTHQAVHQTPRPAPSGDAQWICHIVVALKEPFRPSLVGQADQTTGPVSRYTTDRSATGTRASNPKKRTCRLGLSRERSPQANSVARADVRVPTPSTVAESSPLKQNTRKCPRLSIPRSPTGSTYVSCCRSPQPQPQIEILGRPYD